MTRAPPGRLRSGASVTSTCSISACCVSSRWISPDARKSASTDGSSASIAAGALTTASDTGVLSGRCSSDFFFRIAPRTVAANRSASTPLGMLGTAAGRQHLVSGWPLRLVDRPFAPPRPDFLGDERQERREQAKHRRERRQQRARWPMPRARFPDRRSGVPSPARGSRRRSSRRTSRCARARACSGTPRDRPSTA